MTIEVQKKIAEALDQLFGAVAKLRDAFPEKPFTPDGRLVGDIGEAMASLHYDLTLNEGLTKHHDAIAVDGRNVQIKATFSNHLTFPVHHVPDYYLGIRLRPDGSFEEIYNGPGQLIAEGLARRKPTSTGLHGNLMGMLKRINGEVPDTERIPRR
ncbi:hypothetical protein SA496_14195 [Pseudomonas sp. JS3066]|uniref:DUF6998 domain-containing protein n=1 Tax=Pseudomonas sp. JS3066 TaxID=3090665 RepID=UPI002E7B104D|nr:hypothetical protein [Pseudomonas sp. JS3066]WVK90896.1 hypothetical protein SA496_14195 [Pseudomonas sp. JS3066]